LLPSFGTSFGMEDCDHQAVEDGNAAEVWLRLVGIQGRRTDINAVDDFGVTALHYAAKEGHDAVARLLLESVGGQRQDA